MPAFYHCHLLLGIYISIQIEFIFWSGFYISWRGQCHEIFDPVYFHDATVTHLGPYSFVVVFFMWSKFCGARDQLFFIHSFFIRPFCVRSFFFSFIFYTFILYTLFFYMFIFYTVHFLYGSFLIIQNLLVQPSMKIITFIHKPLPNACDSLPNPIGPRLTLIAPAGVHKGHTFF